MEFILLLPLLLYYIGIPLAIILFLVWIYKIKQNSELSTKQNQRIIQLLEEISKKS
ncbi:hypothetical protein [Oceanobacillus picturae]|uniref:hypothetical protein n=1 Tax=Oceanobacillus picturae TaxID=171693 RepID=UPI000AC2A7EC|nr:hypothetical protein [Oceanobacillus picturae]